MIVKQHGPQPKTLGTETLWMNYADFVSPLASTATYTSTSNPEDVIDMEQVLDICNPTDTRTQWTPDMEDEYLVDKYIVDKYSGGRRFYSKALAPHLKPNSPVPASAISAEPARKYKESILDWSNSLWSRSRKIRTWNPEQPVMEVERIPFRRNFLAAMEQNEKESEGQLSIFVCPEPLKISMASCPSLNIG